MALFVLPVVTKRFTVEDRIKVIVKLQKNLSAVGWFALLVLTGTGLIQMSAHPSYQGFLEISNRWSVAIFAKHIVIMGMITIAAIQTWVLLPGIERTLLLIERKGELVESTDQILAKQKIFLWINLGLAIVVLVFTGIARVS